MLDRLPRQRGPQHSLVDESVESAILAYCLTNPIHGLLRVANSLILQGILVSSTGLLDVWSRHNLLTRHERLMRLDATVRKRSLKLSGEQVRLLERFRPEFRYRHIEANHISDLVAMDRFLVETLKGVWRVYLQSVSTATTIIPGGVCKPASFH